MIDYRIFVSHDNGAFILLDEYIPTRSYQTTLELEPGTLYTFKVQARNSVGYSLDSSTITIRAARIPDAPANVLTTTVESTVVVVSWDAPYDGGSDILYYHI